MPHLSSLFNVFITHDTRVSLYNTHPKQVNLLRMNTLQQLGYRFIVWVLGNEAATDGEIEDGLAELLDLIRTDSQARKLPDKKLGKGANGICIRTVIEVMMGRC
jgi:hypothetical protein